MPHLGRRNSHTAKDTAIFSVEGRIGLSSRGSERCRNIQENLLWAAGGFIVTAEKRDAEIRYVLIESTRGGDFRVMNPWPGEAVRVLCSGRQMHCSLEDGVFTLDTAPGKQYLFHRAVYPPENEYADGFAYTVNPGPKHCGRVRIGLDRVL